MCDLGAGLCDFLLDTLVPVINSNAKLPRVSKENEQLLGSIVSIVNPTFPHFSLRRPFVHVVNDDVRLPNRHHDIGAGI